jgi:hypothetical protein
VNVEYHDHGVTSIPYVPQFPDALQVPVVEVVAGPSSTLAVKRVVVLPPVSAAMPVGALNPVGAVRVAFDATSPRAISESPVVDAPRAKVGVAEVPLLELDVTPESTAEVSPVTWTT